MNHPESSRFHVSRPTGCTSHHRLSRCEKKEVTIRLCLCDLCWCLNRQRQPETTQRILFDRPHAHTHTLQQQQCRVSYFGQFQTRALSSTTQGPRPSPTAPTDEYIPIRQHSTRSRHKSDDKLSPEAWTAFGQIGAQRCR